MKRLLPILLTVSLLATPFTAHAMGSGNQYVDAQTGLTYSLYKPVNTFNLKLSKFQLLQCGGGGEEWLYTAFGTGKKKIEVMQTMIGAHCSNPGLSKQLSSTKINSIPATVHVYCDVTKPVIFKKCSSADIAKVGGYLMMTLPGYYKLKAVTVQVQVTGGLTYAQLLAVSKSFTPASIKPSN